MAKPPKDPTSPPSKPAARRAPRNAAANPTSRRTAAPPAPPPPASAPTAPTEATPPKAPATAAPKLPRAPRALAPTPAKPPRAAPPSRPAPARAKPARAATPPAPKATLKALPDATTAWTIGAIVAAAGAGLAAFLTRGRIASLLSHSKGVEGHVPTDLLDPDRNGPVNESDERAPEAFRPDMDAPMTPGEREALRPATGPAQSFASDRGTTDAQTGPSV